MISSKLTRFFREFSRTEALAGVCLIAATVLALITANTALAPSYEFFFHGPFLGKTLLFWINDGLMALFFLVVGLEIKREFLDGELAHPRKALLPIIAAAGGMIVPALCYAVFNYNNPETANGWAIPAATDIAFALGVLALLGKRIPPALRLFLLALAIIDDLGAIIIIGMFYNHGLAAMPLAAATLLLILLATLNRRGVTHLGLYIFLGALLWACVLASGVHATIAGVLLALTIPGKFPLKKLEHTLHPWVAYGVLPLFALANAGIALEGLTIYDILSPVSLGIFIGLFLGKQFGVMSFSWVSIRLGFAHLPANVSWGQFYGASLLTGIGFTMSLFISVLSLQDSTVANLARVGILAASLLSALAGLGVLWWCTSSALSLHERRKKLIFRSWHRGTREIDLILGRFADAHVPHFSEEKLDHYEALLSEQDPDIYDWITGKEPPPVRINFTLINLIKEN